MKRIALLVLTAAATIDISQKAYNSDLFEAITARGPNQSVFNVVAGSPVMASLEHWALFILAFAFLSLIMSVRKSKNGPDVIG